MLFATSVAGLDRPPTPPHQPYLAMHHPTPHSPFCRVHSFPLLPLKTATFSLFSRCPAENTITVENNICNSVNLGYLQHLSLMDVFFSTLYKFVRSFFLLTNASSASLINIFIRFPYWNESHILTNDSKVWEVWRHYYVRLILWMIHRIHSLGALFVGFWTACSLGGCRQLQNFWD